METPSVTKQLADISQYIWSARLAGERSFANGSRLNSSRDVVLLVQNSALSWGLENDLDGLLGVSNAVYVLCGAVLQEAKDILSNGSGGVVVPATGSGYFSPESINYVVSGLNTPNTTVTSIQNDDWKGLQGLTELTINSQVFQLNVQFLFSKISGTLEFNLSLISGNIYYPQNLEKITSNGLFKIVTS